jgi:hypothetical protein
MTRVPGRNGWSWMTRTRRHDAFSTLGLTADPNLTDDDIRAAWRRIAAGTHPDRADGGDPVRFALAAAAYTELRTSFGRAEARVVPAADGVRRAARQHAARRTAYRLVSMIRKGRPVRLLLRLALASAAAVAGVLAAGPAMPAAPALSVGALTWFLLTARGDLGPQ